MKIGMQLRTQLTTDKYLHSEWPTWYSMMIEIMATDQLKTINPLELYKEDGGVEISCGYFGTDGVEGEEGAIINK